MNRKASYGAVKRKKEVKAYGGKFHKIEKKIIKLREMKEKLIQK